MLTANRYKWRVTAGPCVGVCPVAALSWWRLDRGGRRLHGLAAGVPRSAPWGALELVKEAKTCLLKPGGGGGGYAAGLG
jgi:hypothetical protein